MKLPVYFLLPLLLMASTWEKLFDVLPGKWTMKTKQGIITEEWKREGDSKLTGTTYIQHEGNLRLIERLQLESDSVGLHYRATVPRENGDTTVSFHFVNRVGKYYTFENLQHDFPQRIIYEIVTADSIHARIEGKSGEKYLAEDFYYKRVIE